MDLGTYTWPTVEAHCFLNMFGIWKAVCMWGVNPYLKSQDVASMCSKIRTDLSLPSLEAEWWRQTSD